MPSPSEQVAQALRGAQPHYSHYAGGQLYWQRWTAQSDSAAPPLVLIHGGFGSWNHWFRNISALRQDREVWTLDLPGLGRSGEMPEPHTTQHFAQIVLAGIKQLLGENSNFALAGFSFGAMIAGQLAAMAGTRCSRCTLIGAVGFGELQVQVPLLTPPDAETPTTQAHRIQRENLRRLMFYRPEFIDDLAVYLHGDNLARHRFRSRAIAVSNELAEVLPKIEAPLVGVWGQEDATAGGLAAIDARRDLFQKAQPGAEFHILPNVGHWAMYEAPRRVNQILLSDLRALD